MKESIIKAMEILVPVMVAVITVYGSVTVAKLNSLQKSLKTNHGSKSIGDAVDKLTAKVDVLSSNQNSIFHTVNLLANRDNLLENRLQSIESICVIGEPNTCHMHNTEKENKNV